MPKPSGSWAGRSLALCTARSILSSNRATSISLANIPRGMLSRGASFRLSPPVEMGTTLISTPGKAARRGARTSSVCASDKGLDLEPARKAFKVQSLTRAARLARIGGVSRW